MAKISRTYRLDNVTLSRLDELSKVLDKSKADFIEDLINSAYLSYRKDFSPYPWDEFCTNQKQRFKFNNVK